MVMGMAANPPGAHQDRFEDSPAHMTG